MQLRSEIHELFSANDPRLPPYEQYVDADDRPYTDHGVINFSLQNGIPISDTGSDSPEATGGDNGYGINLPGIDLPAAPIDLSGGSKVSCASTAPIPNLTTASLAEEGDSESESTDSDDDMLARIAQGLAKGLGIQVALNGFFTGYLQCGKGVCWFCFDWIVFHRFQ
jgi:hypothetical protein